MTNHESFMSYELTHDKKGGNNAKSGCLGGCLGVIAAVFVFAAAALGLIYLMV